jgi:hypothetical protein
MRTWLNLLKPMVLLVLLVPLLLDSSVHASFSQAGSTAVIDDVYLLVDSSGSMHQWSDSKGTHRGSDQEDLRVTAARIFADLLSAGDRLGVAAFATKPVDLLPAVGLKGMVELDEKTRGKIKSAIAMGTTTPTGFTDIAQALAFAQTELSAKKAVGHRQSIIIFTDGLPTLDSHPNVPVLVSEVENAAAQVTSKDIAIYSVGLTVDDPSMSPEYIKLFHDMLGRIGTISVDQTRRGGTFIVRSAVDLSDVFVRTLKEVKGQYLRTIEGDSTSIEITPYTQKTVVVSPRSDDTEHCTVIDPGGRKLDPTAFDPNYELFSIDRPAEGTWVVQPPSGIKTILWVLEELTVTTSMEVEARKYTAGDPVPFTVAVNPVDASAVLNYRDVGVQVLVASVLDPNRIVATVAKPEVLTGETWQGTWDTGGLPPGDYNLTVGLIIKGGEPHRGASRIVTLLPKAVISAEGRDQVFTILRNGESYTFAVKFTSPQPSSVAFRLSRELVPYVAMQPAAASIEVANGTQEVTFTLSPVQSFPVDQPVLGQLLFSTPNQGFEVSPPGLNVAFIEEVAPVVVRGGPLRLVQPYGGGPASYPLQLSIACTEAAQLVFSLSGELQALFTIEPSGVAFAAATTASPVLIQLRATAVLPAGQGFRGVQYSGALCVDTPGPGLTIQGGRIEVTVVTVTWWQEYGAFPGIPLLVLVLVVAIWLMLWLRAPAPRGRIALIPDGEGLTTPGGEIVVPPGCPERDLNQRTFISKLIHKSWVSVGSRRADVVFGGLGTVSFRIRAVSSQVPCVEPLDVAIAKAFFNIRTVATVRSTGMRLDGQVRRTGKSAFLADGEVFYVQTGSISPQDGAAESAFVYRT